VIRPSVLVRKRSASEAAALMLLLGVSYVPPSRRRTVQRMGREAFAYARPATLVVEGIDARGGARLYSLCPASLKNRPMRPSPRLARPRCFHPDRTMTSSIHLRFRDATGDIVPRAVLHAAATRRAHSHSCIATPGLTHQQSAGVRPGSSNALATGFCNPFLPPIWP